MDIENKINESIKDSMKSKDSIRLESLRAIKSAILLEKTKTGSKDKVSEEIILKILQKMVKQRNDSAKIYIEQERGELAEVEISQAKIISEFLPEQLSESELSEIIDSVIIDLNAESMKLNNETINDETHQVMINLKNILEEAKMSFNNVVKSSIFLSDMSLFKEVNEIYGSYLNAGNEPARETIAVKTLPMNVNVEISMIAII